MSFIMPSGLGSITLKSNQLYYYYFSILQFLYPAIIIAISFEKVIDYITNYFSTDGTELTGFNHLTIS